MPSSLASGPYFRFLNVARRLRILTGAKFVLIPGTLPATADSEAGQLAVNAAGVVYVYTGTAWVSVGSQV